MSDTFSPIFSSRRLAGTAMAALGIAGVAVSPAPAAEDVGWRIAAQRASDHHIPMRHREVYRLIRNQGRTEEFGDAEKLFGYVVDLNGDGTEDYVLRATDRSCGTGGCAFTLVDGAGPREIGRLFGQFLFRRAQRINGYPVICAYAHASVDSGTYACAVYGQGEYRTVSSVYISGKDLKILFEELDKIPDIEAYLR